MRLVTVVAAAHRRRSGWSPSTSSSAAPSTARSRSSRATVCAARTSWRCRRWTRPGSRGSRALSGSTTSTIRATCIPTDHRHFGPALLTPWPIERTWKLALPHLGRFRHQQRVATAQVRTIIDDAARTTAPVVLAGDFNSYDIGPVLTRAGYRWTTELVGPSISLFSWDHIFVRGLAPASPASVGMVRQVHGASDHRPVWAVMQGDSRGS